MTRMAQIPVKFEPYKEHDDIEDYFERLELFLVVNKVADDQKVPHLLSGLGAKTYAVLKNLANHRSVLLLRLKNC